MKDKNTGNSSWIKRLVLEEYLNEKMNSKDHKERELVVSRLVDEKSTIELIRNAKIK